MATPDSSLSSLTAIRTKIRRLTRSPSTSQITEDQIDDYINTFVLYDFPEITLDSKLTFFVMPNVDSYANNTVNADDPLFNFKNVYFNVRPPVYVAGREINMSQSRQNFYAQYPKTNFSETVGTGDNATVAFSGTLTNAPILARSLTFNSIDEDGNGIVLKDIPREDVATGIQTQVGDLVVPDSASSVGTINYLTGVYSITFPTAPGTSEDVISQAYKYAAGRPSLVLYENSSFKFRPIPDKVYRVELDAYKRPTAMLADAQEPDLAQWWQYIAYGASKKVFEDRMDIESIQAIMPELENQRALVVKKMTMKRSVERSTTIYSRSIGTWYGNEDSY